ncbi:Lipid A export ATP-binding/permease protein MsbA [bioreactor metagenome]|uniref:Lipid A export ATP-binding/permease protein MsbA n=1 Tax=bioreactor metagenome TaxID=1076179 RepID=A0A644V4A1_9ZZZZ
MKNILRIFRYLKGYKREVILNIVFNLLYVFASLFSFVMVIPFVSVLFGIIQPPELCPEFSFNKDVIIDYFAWQLNSYSVTYGVFKCLMIISIIYIFFAFLSALFRYLGMYYLAPIRNGVIKDLRNDIYHKITILPLSFFSNKRKGDLLSRMTSDLLDIEISLISSLQMMIKDPLMVIVFMTTLIIASPKLVLFIVIIMPLVAYLIKQIGASLNRNSEKGQKQIGTVLSTAEETLGAIRVINTYNAEETIVKKFEEQNNRYSKLMTKILRRKELAAPLTEIFGIFALVIIVIFGGLMVINGEINPSILIGFVLLFARILAPMQSVTTAYYNLKKASAAAQRLYEILDAKEKIVEKPDAIEEIEFKNKISYKNVFFSYREENEENKMVLENINLEALHGQTVAIVGKSGSGKSTLIDLLPRFHDVIDGEITIDDVPIKDFNINSLRKIIGVVTQESILFNDTIFGNIAFGIDATLEQVQNAAKAANAHNFILNTPKGYYTNIGDRGLTLSGGERQRICIARAILKNPKILLLDEATSALDTESEKLVQESLHTLMKGRTTFVIAHRLSTIVNSDKIIVMDNGKIVEEGNHQSLLSQNGIYSKLIELQTL